MRKSWLLCVLLGTLAWGQAAPRAAAVRDQRKRHRRGYVRLRSGGCTRDHGRRRMSSERQRLRLQKGQLRKRRRPRLPLQTAKL